MSPPAAAPVIAAHPTQPISETERIAPTIIRIRAALANFSRSSLFPPNAHTHNIIMSKIGIANIMSVISQPPNDSGSFLLLFS